MSSANASNCYQCAQNKASRQEHIYFARSGRHQIPTPLRLRDQHRGSARLTHSGPGSVSLGMVRSQFTNLLFPPYESPPGGIGWTIGGADGFGGEGGSGGSCGEGGAGVLCSLQIRQKTGILQQTCGRRRLPNVKLMTT
jgi:hypothetical protein